MKAKNSKTTGKISFSRKRKITNSSKNKTTDQEKLSQMVRERAYFAWEEKGRPEGQEWETWFQAEKEINAQIN